LKIFFGNGLIYLILIPNIPEFPKLKKYLKLYRLKLCFLESPGYTKMNGIRMGPITGILIPALARIPKVVAAPRWV